MYIISRVRFGPPPGKKEVDAAKGTRKGQEIKDLSALFCGIGTQVFDILSAVGIHSAEKIFVKIYC